MLPNRMLVLALISHQVSTVLFLPILQKIDKVVLESPYVTATSLEDLLLGILHWVPSEQYTKLCWKHCTMALPLGFLSYPPHKQPPLSQWMLETLNSDSSSGSVALPPPYQQPIFQGILLATLNLY